MTSKQDLVSKFYDDNTFVGYSIRRTKISDVIRKSYPDLKTEMNRILLERGGYIKISNIYDNSIEFKYNKKFDKKKQNIEDVFNDLFSILIERCAQCNKLSNILSDSIFKSYVFNPCTSINRDLNFVRL